MKIKYNVSSQTGPRITRNFGWICFVPYKRTLKTGNVIDCARFPHIFQYLIASINMSQLRASQGRSQRVCRQ